MSHTPLVPQLYEFEAGLDEDQAARAYACYHGCVGLTNEQASKAFATITAYNQMLAGMEERYKAYRSVVEALKLSLCWTHPEAKTRATEQP